MTWLCLILDETDINDQGYLPYLLGLNRPLDLQDAAQAQEGIKDKVNAIRKKLLKQVLPLKFPIIQYRHFNIAG